MVDPRDGRLCENGPYAYIRNPFYASYLLSYASSAVALQTWTSVLVLLATSLLFWNIASASSMRLTMALLEK